MVEVLICNAQIVEETCDRDYGFSFFAIDGATAYRPPRRLKSPGLSSPLIAGARPNPLLCQISVYSKGRRGDRMTVGAGLSSGGSWLAVIGADFDSGLDSGSVIPSVA
jgi:hypothetical protein